MRIDTGQIRRSSAGGLVLAICTAVIVSAFPAYATFGYIHDRLVLADRGVQVNAWVVDYNYMRRGRDTVVVRPDEPPYFEATLKRWPGDIAFNDRLDVVFDPRDPGRLVAVDEPLIDSQVLLFAGLDLLSLLFLLRALVAVGELLRRARMQRQGEVASTHDVPPVVPPPRLLAAWRTSRIVLLLVIAPILGASVFALLAAVTISDAAALRASGVGTRAVVVKSVWNADGELDVRFTIQDGTMRSADVTVWNDVHYEGDSVDVVYEPGDPDNARLAGPGGADPARWVYVTAFFAFSATAAVSVPTAVGTLVRRARRGR